MHVEEVEIFSDQINGAVLRHPGRRHPGVLVQGDTLWALCQKADAACATGREQLSADEYRPMNEVRNTLWSLLNHYKAVLGEHDIPLPFSEIS